MSWTSIVTETDGPVGIVRLNRPQSLNALNLVMTTEMSAALTAFEEDDAIGAIVLTGNARAFAAGADIKELQDKTFSDVYAEQLITRSWERPATCRKPIIAAVSGHAAGGGCEIALMCDIVIASETARFSLPESAVGVIPGAGGTQRLTRIVGKAVAMDMILSGRVMHAPEALARGVVSRVAPADSYFGEALALARQLAARSRPIMMLAKEAVNHAHETHLSEGIYLERRLLYATFATDDRREGMTAFTEKRPPVFTNR
ncbi:enoyl-CoA hydratase-related protein [Pararhodobacter zhoushanensis]|uniref:Enoyl-CoA hydratase-related protein n=1 Tax=Pararhodobacter zhoushanensis TaxID=2479545 RepID=A0ABT3H5H8_9RHOB|nr:enoyl-CoA hydratase-related protein [Pararhodobacter zhoushanensis]MCW1934950.1 enoyl-CoA hydratase-related protein [Pararhodobacter zhoushanensis]